MAIFESLVFLQIRLRESVFLKDLKEKEAFLDQQNISLKKAPKLFKGASPWSLSKNGDFLNLRFCAKWIKKKCFLKVPKKKKPF